MIQKLNSFTALCFTALFLVGCASDTYVISEANTDILKVDYSKTIATYYIGAEDVISINVWKNPELSVSVPVRPDGKISMPLIGDIRAAGFTPEEVSKRIQKKLANYVRNPNVTLMITDLRSHEYLTRVRITGAVNTQTSIGYRPGMTVLDAVLVAGSVNDFAAPNSTKLYRKVNGKVIMIDINLGDILNEGRIQHNIELRPGDIITVPERLF